VNKKIMAVIVQNPPSAPFSLQPQGIDPRLFLMIYEDLVAIQKTEPDSSLPVVETKTSSKKDKRLVLPLTLLYRYQWQGPDGNCYPIWADLVYAEAHIMLHKIRPNPCFPERFNGKYFEHLSTSSLYIKPTDYNGYIAWYYQDQEGQFHTVQEARKRGFINSYADFPTIEPRANRISKDVLLRFADMAQVLHPSLARNTGKGGGAKRRKRIVQASTDEVIEHEVPFSKELLQQTWTQCHSVKAFLDYALEVFPGHARDIRVAWSGITALSSMGPTAPFLPLSQALSQALPQEMWPHLQDTTPLLQLGALMLWSMQVKGYVDSLQFATDCANIQTALQMRVRPKEFCLSLSDMLQEFEPRKWLRLQPFALTAETVSVFRGGVVIKNIRTTDLVDEVAHARHVAFNVVKLTVLQHTPKFFLYFSANDK
jgi:hypothetical protein